MPKLKIKDEHGNFVAVPTMRGKQGVQGIQGIKGLDAYELWLSQGNTGTLNDFYRQALRIFVAESNTEVTNPQEGDILLKVKPFTIPSDYLFRFDASQLNLTDGAKVSQWSDLSSNEYQFEQTNTVNQPTFLSTGFNGKPTVHFDGNSFLDISPITITDRYDINFFMVIEFAGASSSRPFSMGNANAGVSLSNLFSFRLSASSNTLVHYINNNESGSATIDNTPFLYSSSWGRYPGNKVYINGEFIHEKDGPQAGLSTAIDRVRVGMSLMNDNIPEAFTGNISELIYYHRDMSIEEFNKINAYLKNKWGI